MKVVWVGWLQPDTKKTAYLARYMVDDFSREPSIDVIISLQSDNQAYLDLSIKIGFVAIVKDLNFVAGF